MEKDGGCKMERQNKIAVVLGRVGEGKMLEPIKKRKRNWLGPLVRRNCQLKDALEGMLDGKTVRGRRIYQMIDNIMVNGLYEHTIPCGIRRRPAGAGYGCGGS